MGWAREGLNHGKHGKRGRALFVTVGKRPRFHSVLSVFSVAPLQRLPAWVPACAGMSGGGG